MTFSIVCVSACSSVSFKHPDAARHSQPKHLYRNSYCHHQQYPQDRSQRHRLPLGQYSPQPDQAILNHHPLSALSSRNLQTSTPIQTSRVHLLPILVHNALLDLLPRPMSQRLAILQVSSGSLTNSRRINRGRHHRDSISARRLRYSSQHQLSRLHSTSCEAISPL